MKDVKTFIIGFFTCACLFLIMGQTDGYDAKYNRIMVQELIVGEIVSVGSIYMEDNNHNIMNINPSGIVMKHKPSLGGEMASESRLMSRGLHISNKYDEKVIKLQISSDYGGNFELSDLYGKTKFQKVY